MIKRNGVELSNERTKNSSVGKETLQIIKQGNYVSPNGETVDISALQSAAVGGTILYKYVPVMAYFHRSTKVEVVNEKTAQAGARLVAEGKDVVVLNFASGRCPGGGFLAGAIAQEEDLCRASGLYTCLKNKPMFYNENIMTDGSFYTDNMIYSPNVPFFRDEHGMFLEKPFCLSVISAPAPNLTATAQDEKVYQAAAGIILTRAQKILEIAANHGHTTIVLGAWGCGAFGNKPDTVANVFAVALEKIPAFEHVCFAVYDTRTPPIIFETFKQVFK